MAALITQLVDLSRRNAAAIAVAVLLLTIAGGYYLTEHLSIDTDIEKLINPDLAWRQREKALDAAFPQNVDLLVAVIDAKTPDQAADAAAMLADKLSAQKTLFKSVRRPDGGSFFQQNGMLFLSTQEVQSLADQLIAAQPLIGTLAADPSLRGVFDALDLAAQGVIHDEIAPKELDAPFTTVAGATDAAVAGRHRPLSWLMLMTGRELGYSDARWAAGECSLDATRCLDFQLRRLQSLLPSSSDPKTHPHSPRLQTAIW